MAVFDEAPECLLLSLNTQADMGTGSSQYNFAQQELAAANQDPTIDWKIVYIILAQANTHIYYKPRTRISAMQRNFHLLFDQYGVDLVLYGHNHNYMRTCTL
jgi:hypothetical protein